jgi:hypothetical protein
MRPADRGIAEPGPQHPASPHDERRNVFWRCEVAHNVAPELYPRYRRGNERGGISWIRPI